MKECDPCIFVSYCGSSCVCPDKREECRNCLGNSCKDRKKRGSKIEEHKKNVDWAMQRIECRTMFLSKPSLIISYVSCSSLHLLPKRTQRWRMIRAGHLGGMGQGWTETQTSDVVPRKKVNTHTTTHLFITHLIQPPRTSIRRPLITPTSDSPILFPTRLSPQQPTQSNAYSFCLSLQILFSRPYQLGSLFFSLANTRLSRCRNYPSMFAFRCCRARKRSYSGGRFTPGMLPR